MTITPLRIGALSALLIILVVGTLLVLTDIAPLNFTKKTDSSYGCTKEARVCADGTIVTRDGPSCTFTECPNDRITDLTPTSTEQTGTTAPSPDTSDDTQTTPHSPSTDEGSETVMCTMDAKQCPDGSYVGRTGPNCEFVCPSSPTPSSAPITVSGSINIGPSCPVVSSTPDPTCDDKPFEGIIVLTNTSTGKSYTAHSGSDGTFTLTLTRGVYDISRPEGENPFPVCSGKIEITGPGAPLPIYCDSGIR